MMLFKCLIFSRFNRYLALVFSLFSTSVFSEEVLDLSLDRLFKAKVTVNSIVAETILESPSTISIISHSDIARYGLINVADAIETVAGFESLRTFSANRLPTSRGILQPNYANKILLTINGIPVWAGITGFTILDRINIDQIKQIEVLKGPGSIQYGTNAYTGVINIVLKNTMSDLTEVSAGVGSDEYYHVNFIKNYQTDEQNIYVALHSEDEKGQPYHFTDGAGNFVDFDDKDKVKNVTSIYRYKNSSLTYNQFKLENSRFGISATATRGGGLTQTQKGMVVAYKYDNQLTTTDQIEVDLSYDEGGRNFFRTQDKSVHADTSGKRYSAAGKWVHRFYVDSIIELGFDIDRRKSVRYNNIETETGNIITQNNMKSRVTYERSFFSRFNTTLNSFIINAGVRITDNELFGINNSFSLSGIWKLSTNDAIKLNYSQSYRAPSLLELFFKTDTNSVIGNIHLEPETSDVYELSYTKAYNYWFFNSTLYTARYKNKISRNSQSYTFEDGTFLENTSVYQNGNEITAVGLENEIRYENSEGLQVFFNFNWVDGDKGDQVNDSYNFKYVSEVSYSTGLSQKTGDWNFAAMVNFRGDSQDVSETLDSTATFDFNISYIQALSSSSLLHSIKLENLSDAKPQVAEYVRRNGADPLLLELEPRVYYQLKWRY